MIVKLDIRSSFLARGNQSRKLCLCFAVAFRYYEAKSHAACIVCILPDTRTTVPKVEHIVIIVTLLDPRVAAAYVWGILWGQSVAMIPSL